MPLRQGVPALARIPLAAWEQEYALLSLPLNDARMCRAGAFRPTRPSSGVHATDDLGAGMAGQDRELLPANARLFAAAIPFLTRPRDRGIKIAIGSDTPQTTSANLAATAVD